MRKFVLAATLIALPLTAFSQDAEAVEDNLEARQGYFKMLSLNMAALSDMAKGNTAYDEAAASLAASNVELLSRYPLPSLFIAGSSADDTKDTAAKADIWSNFDDFNQKFAALAEAATGAGEAVKGGQANIGPVIQKIGGTCKACHDNYREKS